MLAVLVARKIREAPYIDDCVPIVSLKGLLFLER